MALDDLTITKLNVNLTSPDGTLPTNTPEWLYDVDNPYLHGVFAPTTDLAASDDMEVIGTIPDDLYGAYVRNGPNQRFSPCNKYHYYDGDGMLSGIYKLIASYGVEPEKLIPYLTAPLDCIHALIDHIRNHYGSASDYLAQKAGVEKETQELLKEKLLR